MLELADWISVDERLPEKPFGCIVTVWSDGHPDYCDSPFPSVLPYFVGWDGEQWNDFEGDKCPFEVIAWMKAPEPYNPDEDKKVLEVCRSFIDLVNATREQS